MIHRIVRWLGGRALRWFYRDVRIVGAERIPPEGAVLLISNHPNDLPDVLVSFQCTTRPIRHVATAAAALSPPVNFVYRGLGVIPVARVRDVRALRKRGVDIAAINEAALSEISSALSHGDVVGLFPEGGVFRGPGIGPIRSGIAKMVLDSCAGNDVWVVPVGLHYDAPERPGSHLTALIGDAVSLDQWLLDAPSPPHAAFTAKLRELLESVSRTAPDAQAAAQRDKFIAAMSSAKWGATTEAGSRMRAGFFNGWRVAPPATINSELTGTAAAFDESRWLDALRCGWAELLESAALVGAVGTIAAAVEQGGGVATSAGDCAIVMSAAGGGGGRGGGSGEGRTTDIANRHALFLLWTAPLAIPALLLHAPLFLAIWRSAVHLAADLGDRAARAIVPGLYLVIVWYAMLAVALISTLRLSRFSWGSTLTVTALFIVLLPRLGDLAVCWYHRLRRYLLHRAVRRLSKVDRDQITQSMATLCEAWHLNQLVQK